MQPAHAPGSFKCRLGARAGQPSAIPARVGPEWGPPDSPCASGRLQRARPLGRSLADRTMTMMMMSGQNWRHGRGRAAGARASGQAWRPAVGGAAKCQTPGSVFVFVFVFAFAFAFAFTFALALALASSTYISMPVRMHKNNKTAKTLYHRAARSRASANCVCRRGQSARARGRPTRARAQQSGESEARLIGWASARLSKRPAG